MKVTLYLLNFKREQQVSMPVQSQILSVQNQEGMIALWASGLPQRPSEFVEVQMFKDGEDMETHQSRRFIGTVQFKDQVAAIHVFVALS